MKAWTKYNQSMEMASRCSRIFAKVFRIEVTNIASLWIDLYPIEDTEERNIHFVSERNSSELEVYFNFDEPLEYEVLCSLAVEFGRGITDSCHIIGDNGILFMLPDIDVPLYENAFRFTTIEGTDKIVTTDFPLMNFLNTEISLMTQLRCEREQISFATPNLYKNKLPIASYGNGYSGSLRFLVKGLANNTYDIKMIENNFPSDAIHKFRVLSYLTALPFYENESNDFSQKELEIEFACPNSNSLDAIDKSELISINNHGFSRSELQEIENQIQPILGLRNFDAMGYMASI